MNIVMGNGPVDNVLRNSVFDGHFTPILLLLKYPAQIFGVDYTMLFAQAIALSLSFWIALLIGKKNGNNLVFLTVPIVTLTFYVNDAHRFDFHPEMLAIPVITGMLFLIGNKNIWALILFAILGLVSATVKESACAALIGVSIVALLKREKEYFLIALITSILTTLGFLFFTAGGEVAYYRYGISQNSSFITTLWTLFTNIFKLEKIGSAIAFLISFGASFFSPACLGALPPMLFEMASNYRPQWTFATQYSAFILPFALWGASQYVRTGKSVKIHLFLVLLMASLRLPSYLPKASFHHASVARRAIREIPSEYPIMAGDAFFSPLYDGKRNVSALLSVKDFSPGYYFIIDIKRGTYPFNEDEIMTIVSSLFKNRKIRLYFYEDGIMIFRIHGKYFENKEML